MNYEELYCVVETGGTIGENANFGSNRVCGNRMWDNKLDATEYRKRMTKLFGGGYYDYHYSVKTVAWAIKNCKHFNVNDATLQK